VREIESSTWDGLHSGDLQARETCWSPIYAGILRVLSFSSGGDQLWEIQKMIINGVKTDSAEGEDMLGGGGIYISDRRKNRKDLKVSTGIWEIPSGPEEEALRSGPRSSSHNGHKKIQKGHWERGVSEKQKEKKRCGEKVYPFSSQRKNREKITTKGKRRRTKGGGGCV